MIKVKLLKKFLLGRKSREYSQPFESLGTLSYSPSIVTMAVSVAVCEIFSVKQWCDLENRFTVRSMSLEMAPFDRSHTRSYQCSLVTMALSCTFAKLSELLVENRELFIPHSYLAPPQNFARILTRRGKTGMIALW